MKADICRHGTGPSEAAASGRAGAPEGGGDAAGAVVSRDPGLSWRRSELISDGVRLMPSLDDGTIKAAGKSPRLPGGEGGGAWGGQDVRLRLSEVGS